MCTFLHSHTARQCNPPSFVYSIHTENNSNSSIDILFLDELQWCHCISLHSKRSLAKAFSSRCHWMLLKFSKEYTCKINKLQSVRFGARLHQTSSYSRFICHFHCMHCDEAAKNVLSHKNVFNAIVMVVAVKIRPPKRLKLANS